MGWEPTVFPTHPPPSHEVGNSDEFRGVGCAWANSRRHTFVMPALLLLSIVLALCVLVIPAAVVALRLRATARRPRRRFRPRVVISAHLRQQTELRLVGGPITHGDPRATEP